VLVIGTGDSVLVLGTFGAGGGYRHRECALNGLLWSAVDGGLN